MCASSRYSSRQKSRVAVPPAFASSWMARMSPPAQRPRSPAPVSTTAPTPSSCSQSSRAAAITRTMSWVRALMARGRSSSMCPIRPVRVRRTSVVVMWMVTSPLPSVRGRRSRASPRWCLRGFGARAGPHDLLDAVLGEVAVAAVQLQGGVGDPWPVSVASRFAMAQSRVASGSPASRARAARCSRSRAAVSSVWASATRNRSPWRRTSDSPNAVRSPRCAVARSGPHGPHRASRPRC